VNDERHDESVEQDLGERMRQAIEALSGGRGGVAWVQLSFQHAAEALRAEHAYLARVGAQGEIVDVLASRGLHAHSIHNVRVGRSSPGLSASVVAHVLAHKRTLLIEDSRRDYGIERTRAFLGGAWSVLCVPVFDADSGALVAALYFETRSLDDAFRPGTVAHVEAYAEALARAWKRFRFGGEESPCWAEELESARAGLVTDRVDLVGESPAMVALRHRLRRVIAPALAASQADPVLILGPTGSGKEVVARYLHSLSPRARGRFLDLNCATFKGEILESKLFGHVRGAFTGASSDADGLFVMAHGGVLFLDEVGDMPEEGQVMLLRALETRTIRPVGSRAERAVDVQVFCATNVDLEAAVKAKRFRSDLFHRINGLSIRIPALCERPEDIPPLLLHYLAHHEQRLGRRCQGPSREALDLLTRYEWPGNVRELSRACSTLVLHTPEGGLIDTGVVSVALPQVCAVREAESGPRPPRDALLDRRYRSFQEAQDTFARAYFMAVYQRCRGNRVAMARELRLSRSQFYRYAVRFGFGGARNLRIEEGDDGAWDAALLEGGEDGSDGWDE
jgi:DNA-binding NtrC family response regulator